MFDFLTKRFLNSSEYSSINKDVFKAYNQNRPGGAKDLICYVPFNSLTFSWLGKVYACTYNRNILVGEYPKDSIRDIWFGGRLKKLQQHLAYNDLSYGCQHCQYFVDKEKFTGLKPQSFDKYSDFKKFEYPRVMEFEISNKCNLECIMCNGNTSSSIRQNRDKLPALPMPYDDAFVEQMKEFVPHLKEAKFFGGEPFLIHPYFQIWDTMMALNPSIEIFVITNGTILTEKVKELLHVGNFELAISIDSIRKERYEHIRKNANYEMVMQNLDYFNNYTKGRGRTMSLSFTTQRENWDELPEVIEFCNKKGIVFFNSFLTSPFELSLIFLPSSELKEIHAYLSNFELPESNEIEKYNKRCYMDYLNYIKHYEVKNSDGIDYTEQKDNYEAVTPERSAGTTLNYGTRYDLYDHIRIATLSNQEISRETVIQKLECVFETVKNTTIEKQILSSSQNSDLEVMMSVISNSSIDELLEKVKKDYPQPEK